VIVMTHILVALDDSPALDPTARAGTVLARMLGEQPVGIHVDPPDVLPAPRLDQRAGFPVRVETGEVVPHLLAALEEAAVDLAVVGAHELVHTGEVLGHVARALAEATTGALLVVPPRSRLGTDGAIHRALVPLDGDPRTTDQVRGLVERLAAAGVEVVATHVFDRDHPPRCLDAAGHGLEAWRHEFQARHGTTAMALRLRRGPVWQAIRECAADLDADLVVLGWSQHLAPGRAEVVRHALTDPELPVLLLPWRRAPAPIAAVA
jgi:nucleotide-binding universal stress UspA family protein